MRMQAIIIYRFGAVIDQEHKSHACVQANAIIIIIAQSDGQGPF